LLVQSDVIPSFLRGGSGESRSGFTCRWACLIFDSAAVNVAELVGLHNGTVLIATYDWVVYLGQYFKKLPQIKSIYHFRFDKEHPGTVFCKQNWEKKKKAVNLLRN